MEGKDMIKRMREIAEGKLVIMAGGGVTQNNIRELVQYTGIQEVHGSGSQIYDFAFTCSSRLCK